MRVEADDATPAVWGDPADLEAILIGLAANARDALQDGGTFELVVARGHREGPSAVLEVRDTGLVQSLPPTARAVEPFFSTKPLGVGTGLGLASAQTLVSSLGGRFELEARSGGGTVARIELPGVQGDTTVEERSAPLSGSFGRPPMRALLWEPHGGLRSGLRRTLEEEGFHVTLAGDPGFSGMTVEPAPGVVVSDVPDVHGSEHRILARVAAGFPGVPVILLGRRPSLPPPADIGIRVAYLPKPFSRARFASALGVLTSTRSGTAFASSGEGAP